MNFKKDHPMYKGYGSDSYHVNKLPKEFRGGLEGYITRHCRSTGQLKIIVNLIASHIPTELTQNWGWDFLISDLSDYLRRFEDSSFHKSMDLLFALYEQLANDIDTEEFNEFLDDLNLGYELCFAPGRGYFWGLKEDVSIRAVNLSETSAQVKDICTQTLEHLEQSTDHLLSTENNRDRKDAVRDCMSALESLLKNITNENDIKQATAALRRDKGWGPDAIVKDGLSLWNKLHDLYPDMRHGNPVISTITDDEALYWIDRITTYIRYLSRVYKQRQYY